MAFSVDAYTFRHSDAEMDIVLVLLIAAHSFSVSVLGESIAVLGVIACNSSGS